MLPNGRQPISPGAFVMTVSLVLIPTAGFGQERERSPETGGIAQAISDLASPRFRLRQAATAALIKAGPEAVVTLRKRVLTGTKPEVCIRAMTVFEANYVSDDKQRVTTASPVLEELAISKQPQIALHARRVLRRNQAIRTKLALAAIRKLKGQIHISKSRTALPNQFQRPAQDDLRTSVVLEKDWAGGVDGLKYVRRIKDAGIPVYLIQGLPVPEEAQAALVDWFDSDRIVRRGPAMLGISADGRRPCTVGDVMKDSAAAKGGLKAEDIIDAMDGEIVHDFVELVDMLRRTMPGQKVRFSVRRRAEDDTGRLKSESLELTVTMQKWMPPGASTPDKPKVIVPRPAPLKLPRPEPER